MKTRFIYHPFLLAIFPVFFIYNHNLHEIFFTEVIVTSLLLILGVLILQLLLRPIIKNENRMALVISFILIIFFSFGPIRDLLSSLKILSSVGNKGILLFLGLSFIAGILFILKTKRDLVSINSTFNLVSIILLIFPVAGIVMHAFENSDEPGPPDMKYTVHINSVDPVHDLPDIYYIVLDGYANGQTLKEIYDYDNSEFEEYLTEKGFYIAKNSTSNYAETRLCFASTLYMRHLHEVEKSLDVPTLHYMIENNRVTKFLKKAGYNIIDISSSNIGKIKNIKGTEKDEIKTVLSVRYLSGLLDMTLLSAFENHLDLGCFYREEVINTFNAITGTKKNAGKPNFIFAHILSPHPPYIFDEDSESIRGSLRLDIWGNLESQKELYVGQLISINTMIINTVEKILSESKQEPIIIIQSDHGPEILTKDRIKTRMKIFNAFYFPKKDSIPVYNSITPVNTFRIIFNKYLNTEFGLLEDKNYFTNYELPYKFEDVTSIVNSWGGDNDIRTRR